MLSRVLPLHRHANPSAKTSRNGVRIESNRCSRNSDRELAKRRCHKNDAKPLRPMPSGLPPRFSRFVSSRAYFVPLWCHFHDTAPLKLGMDIHVPDNPAPHLFENRRTARRLLYLRLSRNCPPPPDQTSGYVFMSICEKLIPPPALCPAVWLHSGDTVISNPLRRDTRAGQFRWAFEMTS